MRETLLCLTQNKALLMSLLNISDGLLYMELLFSLPTEIDSSLTRLFDCNCGRWMLTSWWILPTLYHWVNTFYIGDDAIASKWHVISPARNWSEKITTHNIKQTWPPIYKLNLVEPGSSYNFVVILIHVTDIKSNKKISTERVGVRSASQVSFSTQTESEQVFFNVTKMI